MVSAYHRAATEGITRYGGHVAKYLGDGVMAYFGWPEAHENDAERAVRAGLAVLEEASKLNPNEPTHPKVSVRVGIDSGAGAGGANYIVSGDRHLRKLKVHTGIPILTARQLLETLALSSGEL